MKKLLLFSLCSVFCCANFAAITVITVTNFQFSPANPTVTVGDTIRFDFVINGGFHNAVSTGNTLPPNAAAINSGPASSTARTYDYKVTEPGIYSYYCEIHGGPNNSGMAANFTATAPLPLDMGDFSASIATDKSATISWNTFNEKNVNYFSLQRSIDAVHFTEIATLNALKTKEQQYSFTDKAIPATRYIFYQLVITDMNGAKTFSKVITLKNIYENGTLITKIGPSPLTRPEQLIIQFNAEKEGFMDVAVYNVKGKEVMTTKMQAMPGLNNGHLHLCDLGPGTYAVKLSYESKEEIKKVVVY